MQRTVFLGAAVAMILEVPGGWTVTPLESGESSAGRCSKGHVRLSFALPRLDCALCPPASKLLLASCNSTLSCCYSVRLGRGGQVLLLSLARSRGASSSLVSTRSYSTGPTNLELPATKLETGLSKPKVVERFRTFFTFPGPMVSGVVSPQRTSRERSRSICSCAATLPVGHHMAIQISPRAVGNPLGIIRFFGESLAGSLSGCVNMSGLTSARYCWSQRPLDVTWP